MKEAISELRSAIRRLRPHLLCHQHGHHNNILSSSSRHQQQTTAGNYDPSSSQTIANDGMDGAATSMDVEGPNTESSIVNELQTEATSELINAIATFVWNLDCLWDSCAADDAISEGGGATHDSMLVDGDGDGEQTGIQSNSDIKLKRAQHAVVQEPHTEWNDEAKSLIREGYGLIVTISQPTSTFSDDGDCSSNNNYQNKYNPQNNEAARTIARSSILELLPSLSTSPCRHLLLGFLPHFMPLEALSRSSGMEGGNSSGVPSWLHDDGWDERGCDLQQANQHQDLNPQLQSSELVDNTIVQILEAFESLIQTDVSTLVPFLATLSIIFESLPDGGGEQCSNTQLLLDTNNDALNQTQKHDSPEDATLGIVTDSSKDTDDGDFGKDANATIGARSKCFHLCLSSLPSISEYDLPSLFHSLFTLIRNEKEGRLAMDAVRAEWTSICGNPSSSSSQAEKQNTIYNSSGDNLLLFIGNVIIQSILSYQIPGSSHLANGFLHSLKSSLHNFQHTSSKQDNTQIDAQKISLTLTSLDAIVLIALYSNSEYQQSIEAIFDSMLDDQALIFFGLIQPLIQSWLPSDNISSRWSERERSNSLLYEPLVSSLISLLFYIMMASCSLVEKNDSLGASLLGGLLPFHAEAIAMSSQKMTQSESESSASFSMITNSCCSVLSELYSAVDPQRQEQIVNSLLSMVSDSFVRSSPSDISSSRRGGKGHNQQVSNSKMIKEKQRHHIILLEAARSACRTLVLITNNHASELSQIRGVVLDRLLLLASMSVMPSRSPESSEGNEGIIAYHLFDMNCAILISLLQDTQRGGSHISEGDVMATQHTVAESCEGSSELLILCQKLLFSANFAPTSNSIANNSYQHRAVCSILLASRLLRCKLIPSGERGSICSWIMTVISPSSSAATPLEALEPEIGRWGLIFLQYASSTLPSNTNFPEMAPFVGIQPVCGQSDVFNQVNKMLATAAIVQMEDSLRVPLLNIQGTESHDAPLTFLAFSEVSKHDHLNLRKKKSTATTRMVVCPVYFLNGAPIQTEQLLMKGQHKHTQTPINLVAEYVYDLVDRYLELGTSQSGSWNPRGWLLAKIQLPCCLSPSTMEALEIDSHYRLETDAGLDQDDNFQKRWKQLFVDDTKSKATLVEDLFGFVRCVIISISVSGAVLKHAYRHFESEETRLSSMVNDNGGNESEESLRLGKRKKRQLEALRKLLQFQVNKIHKMQRICQKICLALDRLCSEVLRLKAAHANLKMGRRHLKGEESVTADVSSQHGFSRVKREDEASYEKKQISLSEVKVNVTSIISFMSSRINNIDNSIYWSCLEDDADDALLLEHFENIMKSTRNESESSCAASIIRLRKNILQRLQQNILRLNDDSRETYSEGNGLQRSKTLSPSGIARLFRLTVLLVPFLNHKGEGGPNGQSIVGAFLLAHYKLLLAALSVTTKGSVLKSSGMNNLLLPVVRKKAAQPIDGDNNCSWLSSIIESCAQSLPVTTPLQSGALPTPAESLSTNLLQQLNHCEDASISCHLLDLLSIIFLHTKCSRGVLAEVTSGALHSLYTSGSGGSNVPYTYFIMNDILSKAIKEEHGNDRISFINESIASLNRVSNVLLKGRDAFTVAFVHHTLSHWSALMLEGASQYKCLNEMVYSIDVLLSPASKRSKKSVSSPHLPALGEKTFAALFEMLLHMINASLSSSKPASDKKKCPSDVEGPYEEIMWPLKVFGKLLSIFQSNHEFLPRRYAMAVVKSSLLMTRLSEYQLRQCVEWRNSQHSQLGIGFDAAAVEFLQPLVDDVAVCIGSIMSFCNLMRKQQDGGSSWDKSYKLTKAIAGLVYQCELVKDTLQRICQSQRLAYPKHFKHQQSKDSPKRKGGGEGDGNSHKKSRTSKDELSLQRKIRARGTYSKPSGTQSILELLRDSNAGFEYINENDSNQQSDSEVSQFGGNDDSISMDGPKDDDSFGAIGDWAT